jgi:hypothetical protein
MTDGQLTDAQVLGELENAQTILVQMLNDFVHGRLKGADATAAVGGIKERLLRVIPKDSLAFPPIDRISLAPLSVWSHMDGYASSDRPIVLWHTAIENAIRAIRPDVLGDGGDCDEYYFSPGQRYDALRTVLGIMRRATVKVLLIDPYMDDAALDLARTLDAGVRVELLTTNNWPMFARLYQALVGQRGEVEARRGTGFHDRFVVVDERDVWTVGSSFNSLGEKATSIHRLRDPSEIEKQLRDVVAWWSRAVPVPPPS